MTTRTPREPAEDFTDGEGLRALLTRLHEAGPGAWQSDPVAAALMEYAADKYGALARKHGLDPWEAASAAFDVMRTKAVRTAAAPWGVVTHAVRITCIAEERGQGLLCSVHQARRPHISAHHDPERLSDRENPLTDYATTAAGKGILLRLVIGESLRALLRDDDLILMVLLAAPKHGG